MNDLVPTDPPEPQPNGQALGQELVELLRQLTRNAAASGQADGPHVAPTINTIFAWYDAQLPATRHALAVKEEKRVRQLFAAYHGETDREPWGQRTVDTFKPFHLKEFLDREAGGLANWTRKRWASAVTAVLAAAHRLGLVAGNPFASLRLPQGREGRDWKPAEFQTVLRAATPQFRRLLMAIRVTGMRPGEARKAKWEHWDIPSKCLILREHKSSHVVEAPRVVHLNDVATKLLSSIKRRQPDDQPFIFVNKNNNPWTMRMVTQYLEEIRGRCNLPADLKLHGLRHTFATNGLTNGLDIATVGALLGHANISSTQRYSHLAGKKEHLQDAAQQAVTGRKAPPGPPPRISPAELSRQAAVWAFARKPELLKANAVQLHAYLLTTEWGPWLPTNVRTFGAYLTPSRQAREEAEARDAEEGGKTP